MTAFVDVSTARHPAKFHDRHIPIFAEALKDCRRVLDPFGGVGKLAEIRQYGWQGELYINELEPEWAAQAADKAIVTVADAEHLPFLDGHFDGIGTSPTFGNRMADHCNWRDTSKRITYKSSLQRALTNGNTGAMQWGDAYRAKHERTWRECWRVLGDGGLLVVNSSNHIRRGQEQYVTEWHSLTLQLIGFTLLEHHRLETPRLRFGANHRVRVGHESILVYRKEAKRK